MLIKLKKEQNLTYMFITHDMGVMRNVSNRVAIMYLGKICEIAPTETFYRNPLHPYTQMLLSSIPVVSEEDETIKPKAVECVGKFRPRSMCRRAAVFTPAAPTNASGAQKKTR